MSVQAPISPSTVSSSAEATSLPENFDYLDEKNIEKYHKFILCEGNLEINASGGKHAYFYMNNGGAIRERPDVKIEGFSRFGLGYSGETDAKRYGKKLVRPKPKAVGEEKSESKETDKDPGYAIAFAIKDNTSLEQFGKTVDYVGKREFCLHSLKLNEGEKMEIDDFKKSGWASVLKLPKKKKENAVKYGPSLRFKVDVNTLFYKKDKNNYDIPCSMEDVWMIPGNYTIFGEIHKLNIGVMGGHTVSFYAKTCIFTPKVAGPGKASKYINAPPKDYNPNAGEDSKADAKTDAKSSTDGSSTSPSSSTSTATTGASSSTSPTSGGEPLDITGAVSNKRKFPE